MATLMSSAGLKSVTFPQNGLSPCQQLAWDMLTGGSDNIFLTGCAGSGKSFLVRKYLNTLEPKTVPVLASTGAAAVLVGGRTFHSFFGLGIMEGGRDAAIEKAANDKRVQKRLRAINGFILDEVSMIPSAALEAAEAIARRVRHVPVPWGGLRVIAVGDFAQLPPVTRGSASKDWAFLSEAWQRTSFVSAVLQTVMRSEDPEYLAILNDVRMGTVTERLKAYLNARTDPEADQTLSTYLFPRRDQTESYNLKRLSQIEGDLEEFPTRYAGEARARETLKTNAPIPEVLRIKIGALVMLRVNDPAYRFVNGSTGIVRNIRPDRLTIELKNRREVEIEKTIFAQLDADGNAVATAENFPVTLAYATTIHKAQGATLDALVVDLRNLWEPGQAYVALSRLKSGEGLTLSAWSASSIRADDQVSAFHESLMK